MKKSIKLVLITILLGVMLLLAGCSFTSNKSYTYDVETGDKIKVRLDTTEKWDLDSEMPFNVYKDDEKISTGMFIKEEQYNQYMSAVESASGVKVIDEGSRHGTEYLFYEYKNYSTNKTEYNYIIKVNGSKTGILLGNNKSQKLAEECFERLTFTKEK